MSLLALGTQDSVQDCYLPDGSMNTQKLNEHLQDFDNKFSHDRDLVNSVRGLTSEDESRRQLGQSQGGY